MDVRGRLTTAPIMNQSSHQNAFSTRARVYTRRLRITSSMNSSIGHNTKMNSTFEHCVDGSIFTCGVQSFAGVKKEKRS